MTHVNDSFKGYQHFEFSYIKDLAEPSKKLSESDDKAKNKAKKAKPKKSDKEGKDEYESA